LTQKSKDKNKIYSLHEPQTLCLSKGKVHKKYEFGSKASIAITKNSGLIVAARSFSENIYDGHTLPDTLCQIKAVTGQTPSLAIGDRGYRGKKQIEETKILIPGKNPASLSDYAKRQKRLRLKRRSAIEAMIGHLKADFRLARCFLTGWG
jgi:IS5 family transposase